MFKNIRQKLSNQLSFYIIMSVLSVFIIIGITTYLYMDNILEERIKSKTYIQNKTSSQEIETIFNKASIITKQMSTNNEIKTYLHEVKTPEDILSHPLYNSVLETMKGIHSSSPLNYVVWIANENASFFIDSEGFVSKRDYDISKRPWYQSAIKAKDVSFSPVYTDWKTKTHVISSILALREANNIYGFIAVDTTFDSIPSIYEGVDIGLEGKIFLLTEDGRYIYKSNSSEAQTNELLSIYDVNDPLSSYADMMYETKEGFEEVKIDNDWFYLSYYPATDNNWISIYLINKAETKQELFSFTILLFFLLIIAILILIFTIHYMISSIILPIKTITNYSKEISSGKFSHSLPKKLTHREDEIGDLSRSFNIITDVFREKNMMLENRIEDKNEEIQKQYQYIIENEKLASLATLVAGVAHEINTPIGVALTSSSYIQKLCRQTRLMFDNNTMKKSDFNHFMNELDQSNKLLLDNIYRSADLIRSFKKIAVDQSNETRSIFNINEHVESIITSLRHEYKNKHIHIKNYCPKNLMLDGYPGPFSQVITNLIMNSIQHAYKGGSGGLIIIKAQRFGDKIEIHYIDDGSGIKDSYMPNIFDPFFTTNREAGSSGLGLHIVYNIITQLLDGTITCVNNHEAGVNFTITIPVTVIEKPLLYK
ncbi:MAG: ATP-binding protein [Acidaminobacteraceae bacterium]